MMPGRHILQSCRPHFGFTPHQLSGVLQTRTDKSVHFVKPHGLPIVPSHVVWRVFAIAPTVSNDYLSPSPPPKVELGDIKWMAAPLPEIKEMVGEPASLKHYKKPLRRHGSAPSSAVIDKNDDLESKKSAPHPAYNLDTTLQTLSKPKKIDDHVTPSGNKTVRLGFDLLAGYRGPSRAMTAKDWLNRCLFLETIAVVARHVVSQRSLKQDAQSFLEDERVHQLIFMDMKEPGWFSRMAVIAVQGIAYPALSLAFMVSPKTCHHLVEVLEKEAVKTYTFLLEEMEHGHLDEWCTTTAPRIGRLHYDLPDDANVYDMIKCIRLDEARHHDMKCIFDHKRTARPFVGLH